MGLRMSPRGAVPLSSSAEASGKLAMAHCRRHRPSGRELTAWHLIRFRIVWQTASRPGTSSRRV